MGTLFVDTGGNATYSGSTDSNTPTVTGSAGSVVGSDVTLDGAPDLSGIITSGGSQSSINLASATNANLKIFWITGVIGSSTVTTHVAPACSTSAWVIGGRHVLTNASIEGALRGGDTVIFNNSPAAQAATMWTFRNAGSTVSGPAKIMGKIGVRPVLNTSNTAVCVSMAQASCFVENLEIDQDGSSGNAISVSAANQTYYNVKVVDAGGIAIGIGSLAGQIVFGCDISGVGGDAITTSGVANTFVSNYIHDLTGDGIENTGTTPNDKIINNIIDTCNGRGIAFSGSIADTQIMSANVLNNTVYNCGNNGLEVTDKDFRSLVVNNIFHSNGSSTATFNIKWMDGSADMGGFHAYNVIFQGGGVAGNTNSFTANAFVANSEFTTDPLLVNPAGGDFTPGTGSNAMGTGFPGTIDGSTVVGYMDIGAIQVRQSSSSATLANVTYGFSS